MLGPGILAHITVGKYADHLLIYRQKKITCIVMALV